MKIYILPNKKHELQILEAWVVALTLILLKFSFFFVPSSNFLSTLHYSVKMGCCCVGKSNNDAKVEIISSTTNVLSESVCPKIGARGNSIKVSYDNTKKYYSLTSDGGSGVALGSCHLDCDCAYWEIKIGKKGCNDNSKILIGVKRYKDIKVQTATKILDQCFAEDSTDCWYLKSEEYKSGDVIGIYFDQTDLPILSFSLNGVKLSDDTSIFRIRPSCDLVPAVSLEEGCSVDVIFDENAFNYPPANSKFRGIICSSSII